MTSNNDGMENDDSYPVSQLLRRNHTTIKELQIRDWDKLLSSVLGVNISNSSRNCDIDLEIGCSCKHLAAVQRENPGKWRRHHQNLVQTAQSFNRELDVFFVGDSIIEQWNGTKYLGSRLVEDNRKSFQNTFSKAHGAKLEGLAIGSAGDIIQNLNWHLRNGILPERLKTKVIWILIGTNNFEQKCSTPANVASGVLEVVYQAHRLKPNAKIVVQGILPRADSLGNFSLGNSWNDIQRTNNLLKSFTQHIPFFHYYEFPSEELLVSEREINDQYLRDGVHPSTAGYDLMGRGIEAEVLELLS